MTGLFNVFALPYGVLEVGGGGDESTVGAPGDWFGWADCVWASENRFGLVSLAGDDLCGASECKSCELLCGLGGVHTYWGEVEAGECDGGCFS